MSKKILSLVLVVLLMSSCKSKMSQHQASESVTNEQQSENFEVIDSEKQAEEMNKAAAVAEEEVEVQDRVFFDLGKSNLLDSAKKVLDVQSSWLKSEPSIKIIVEGHCDDRGSREYNIALGEKRANSVKQYLVSNGVEKSRVKTISYGKEKPAFVGSGEEVWSKNRRAVTVMQDK